MVVVLSVCWRLAEVEMVSLVRTRQPLALVAGLSRPCQLKELLRGGYEDYVEGNERKRIRDDHARDREKPASTMVHRQTDTQIDEEEDMLQDPHAHDFEDTDELDEKDRQMLKDMYSKAAQEFPDYEFQRIMEQDKEEERSRTQLAYGALILLANGVEELDVVSLVSALKEANIEVVTASIDGSRTIRGKQGLTFRTDTMLSEVDSPLDFLGIVIPGGDQNYSRTMSSDERVRVLVRCQYDRQGVCCGLGSGVITFKQSGILYGRQYAAPPDLREQLPDLEVDVAVKVDEHLVTSQGGGTALDTAMTLIELYQGQQAAVRVARACRHPRLDTKYSCMPIHVDAAYEIPHSGMLNNDCIEVLRPCVGSFPPRSFKNASQFEEVWEGQESQTGELEATLSKLYFVNGCQRCTEEYQTKLERDGSLIHSQCKPCPHVIEAQRSMQGELQISERAPEVCGASYIFLLTVGTGRESLFAPLVALGSGSASWWGDRAPTSLNLGDRGGLSRAISQLRVTSLQFEDDEVVRLWKQGMLSDGDFLFAKNFDLYMSGRDY
eukprot:767102-Hanusia_phi.AAC.6